MLIILRRILVLFMLSCLAYQAIFENHYRLDDWEKKRMFGSYNIDAGFL